MQSRLRVQMSSSIMSGVITNGKYWTTDCIRHPKRRSCVCCPNGAHIDVDFDMFYKTLTKMQQHQQPQPRCDSSGVTTTTTTNSSSISTTKQYKHFRRKQDPTIDALLGYRNKSQSTVDIDEIVYKSRDMPAKASPDVQESLEQALHDFEETLIRSSTTDVHSPLVSPLLANKFSSSLSLRSDTKSDNYYRSMNGDRYSGSFEPITTPPEMFRSSTESIRTESTKASSDYLRTHSPLQTELESPLQCQKCTTKEMQPELHSPSKFLRPTTTTNDVAINCKSLTRDVATSSISPFQRTIATNTSCPSLSHSSTMTEPVRKESTTSFTLSQILDERQPRKVATVGTQTYSRVSSLIIIEKRDQGIQTETESNDSRLRNVFTNELHKRSVATSTEMSHFSFELQPILENRRLNSKYSQTKDVVVRERVICKKVASQTESGSPNYKDCSSNTQKKRLKDASTGDSPLSSAGRCEKCNQTRNNDNCPTDLVTNQISHTASKIPRPKSLQTGTNSNNKKRMLMRQDTYVTIPSPELEKLKEMHTTGSTSDSQTELSYQDSVNTDNGNVWDLKQNESFFLPISDNKVKSEPSKEMKAAMKVLNDSIKKPNFSKLKDTSLRNAIGIIQQEWFKISSLSTANPLVVEDYLDAFEAVSTHLLEFTVNLKDGAGNTAMHYAVSHGNFDIVSILLDSKVCDINVLNDAGYTCIMLVSLAQIKSTTHCDVIRRLFSMADVNKKAKQHGQTTLMLAASHGKPDIVKLLLECGADLNIQDDDGSTALMCAAEHGYLNIVNVLATHPDVDLSIKDNDGSSALTIAMEAGHREIGIALYTRQHFADLNHPAVKEKRSRSANPILMEHRRALRSAPPSPSPFA